MVDCALIFQPERCTSELLCAEMLDGSDTTWIPFGYIDGGFDCADGCFSDSWPAYGLRLLGWHIVDPSIVLLSDWAIRVVADVHKRYFNAVG